MPLAWVWLGMNRTQPNVTKLQGMAMWQDPTGMMDAGLHASALEAHRGVAPSALLRLTNVRLVSCAAAVHMPGARLAWAKNLLYCIGRRSRACGCNMSR